MGIVGLDHLAQDIVEAYTNGVDDMTGQAMSAAKARAEQCRDNIQKDSPAESHEYEGGWIARKTKLGYVVYNRTKPNIEMPLEHGRVITRGPNKGKRVRARPHIYANADKARDDFYNDCLKIVRKG